MSKAKCDMNCFECIHPDCILPKDKSEKVRSEQSKEKNRVLMRKLYAENKKAGICVECKRAYATNGLRCYPCHVRNRKRVSELYNRNPDVVKKHAWDDAGLCKLCGGKRVEGKSRCKSCLEELRKKREAKKLSE